MSDQSILLREDKGEICELILNRPKAHNSLSKDLLLRLLEEFKKIEKEIKIKIVIISANGPSFCSGHDLKEIKNNPDKNTYKNLFEFDLLHLSLRRRNNLLICLLFLPT